VPKDDNDYERRAMPSHSHAITLEWAGNGRACSPILLTAKNWTLERSARPNGLACRWTRYSKRQARAWMRARCSFGVRKGGSGLDAL